MHSITAHDRHVCPNEIAAEVQAHLRNRLSNAVMDVAFDYRKGVLTLRGQLVSFYQKQLAQEAVRNLDGVRQIVNCIEVASSSA